MAEKLQISRVGDATIKLPVLVQFHQANGSVYQGEFTGEFKRLSQDQINNYLDDEEAYQVAEVISDILVGASNIAATDGSDMPADEALAWAQQSPECVGAAYAAFFKAMRPERYNEKTSQKSRKAGRR